MAWMPLEDFLKVRSFCAIDFETANALRDSVCAVGMVRVEDRRIVTRAYALIQPPKVPGLRDRFTFQYLHGIGEASVRGCPTFAEVWPGIRRMIDGCEALVAHNAGFDRSVMLRAARLSGCEVPERFLESEAWVCTMMLARKHFGMKRARLNDVCAKFGIELNHHDAASDALAAAKVALRVWG